MADFISSKVFQWSRIYWVWIPLIAFLLTTYPYYSLGLRLQTWFSRDLISHSPQYNSIHDKIEQTATLLDHLTHSQSFDGTWNSQRDSKNLLLTSSQCRSAFPGLNHEIARAMVHRLNDTVTPEELSHVQQQNGSYRAMIYDNELYVLNQYGTYHEKRGMATLHAIHRALVTSPERLPNIEFVFTVRDNSQVDQAVWSYTRALNDTNIWLIPDHGFWAWPGPKVGSYGEVRLSVSELADESREGWSTKIRKLVWRGALLNLTTRKSLLAASSGKVWSDVSALEWSNKSNLAAKHLSMADHCRFKYLAHVEGHAYSGRLKYLLHCRSVIITHPWRWLEFHHHLFVTSGEHQNVVLVKEDWSDLDEKMEWLIAEDERAIQIAENGLEMFGQRYLTPAAEMCYWRSLFSAWRSVSFEADVFEEGSDGKRKIRGVPFESFALEGRMEWDTY